MSEAREHISKGLMRMMRKTPFFTSLLLRSKIIESESMDALMGVDGTHLYYNPAVKDLNLRELVQILYHEAMHVANQHHIRAKQLQEKYKREIKAVNLDFPITFNIAADLAINSILADKYENIWRESNVLKNGCVPGTDPFEDFPNNKPVEFYFKQLLELAEKCDTPDPVSVLVEMERDKDFKDHANEIKHSMKLAGEVLVGENSIEEMTNKLELDIASATIASKAAGEDHVLVNEILQERDSEKHLNWRTELDTFFKQVTKGKPNYKKPSRRFPNSEFIMPSNRDKQTNKIILLLDTSGSMSDDDVAKVYDHVEQILSVNVGASIELVPFDDEVFMDNIYIYDRSCLPIKPIDRKRFGCGGTNFTQALKYAEGEMPQGIIMLTDMMPYDDNEFKNHIPKFPTLFISVFLLNYSIKFKENYCCEPRWANITYLKKDD